jgi:replicative DNA helicase
MTRREIAKVEETETRNFYNFRNLKALAKELNVPVITISAFACVETRGSK